MERQRKKKQGEHGFNLNPETVCSLPSLQVHLLLCGAILNLEGLSGQCGA